MPYQNSTGSQAIQSQFYNWQYFNHGMAKLGGVKPSGTNINYKSPEGVNYFNNWMGDVVNFVSKGADLYSEWRIGESKKNAAEYLKTHSLDEYKDDIQRNGIPFQYDTIAMSELKRGYGEITFNLAKQEWIDKVKSGEFANQNLTDEQMDARYFKFVRGRQSEVAKFLGYAEDDEDFVAGYYKNSPAARVEVGMTNRAVTDAWNVQKESIKFGAQLQALVSDSRYTPQQVGAGIARLTNGVGTRHQSPETIARHLASAIETLCASGNQDAETMKVIGDTVINKKTGKTLRDFFGDGLWNLYTTKAQNAKTLSDAEAYQKLDTEIETAVEEGSVEQLQNMLNVYLSNASTQISANDIRFKMLNSAIERAKRQRELLLQKRQLEEAQENKARQQAIVAKGYVDSLTMDSRDQFEPKQFGVSNEEIQQEWNARLSDAAMSNGDAGVANCMLQYDKANAWYNPVRTYIKNVWTNEIDSFKSQLINYTKQTQGGKSDTKVPAMPQCIRVVKEMLNQDSDKTSALLAGSIDSNTLGLITALATAEQQGISWEEACKGQAKVASLRDRSLDPDGLQKLDDFNRAFNAYYTDYFGDYKMDGALKDIVKHKALYTWAMSDSYETAIKTAMGDVKNSTVELGDTRIPNAFFVSNVMATDINLKYTKAFLEDRYPTSEYTFLYSYADNAIMISRIDGSNAGKIIQVLTYTDNLARNKKTFEQHALEKVEQVKAEEEHKKLFWTEGYGQNYMEDQ